MALFVLLEMSKQIPAKIGFRMPAEFEKQDAVWLSWPHNKETFFDLEAVEQSYFEFVKALCGGQRVNIIGSDIVLDSAKKKLGIMASHNNVVFHNINTVDSWIRDYGPIFVTNGKELAMVKWQFNAWGNKYDDLKLDNNVPFELNKKLGMKVFEPGIVMEGGSIEVNGNGLLLTTEQCLLNKNRNPSLSKEEIEKKLMENLNVHKVLWLKEGITGDDTDGHIDDIARFVSADTVVCAFEDNKEDENHELLKANYEVLCSMTDTSGNKLNVVKLPMPGIVEDEYGRLPASYANFYVGNNVVCVPVFGHENDKKALDILQKLFPGKNAVGINCKAMISGLGTLHCCSQQQPRVK